MTVTLSVDATSRIARFEFSSPHLPSGMVYGYSEVLLQEPDSPSKGAEILRPVTPMMGTSTPTEGEKITYGIMPGTAINRGIPMVMEETVDVDGNTISFATVLQAMGAFFEKWRVEDATKPPPMMMAAQPPTLPPPDPDIPLDDPVQQ
jgi:hypothetical protein